MSGALLDTDYENAKAEELCIESKRAINYLQVHRNYRYVEFLAHGGYGWVSLVYDESEKRPLAIKCTTDTSEMELTWWPKLDHDTILPLIEYITLDSCTVFIMPAMRKDLWMCINEPQFYQDELSFGLCRIWLGDVATALNYLHSQHLCHLDLKLDNVFLKDNGRVCLGDFSLLSDTRQVPAKFHFLELYEPPEYTDWCHSSPPEAISQGVHKEGDKADMWQFGILSLDLLTNLKLSDGQSSQFVLWHHDVWPFIQKVLLHKEYLQFLMEDAFKNVLFNDLDFDLSHEFLQDILVLEPGLRISASEAMKHDFVTIQWPQVPSTFGMPKQIVEHPSKPRAKKKMKPATGEGEVERVGAPLEEDTSKQAVDALKTKMDKIQKEKMKRRESLAAVAGKNPVKIKQNLSSMLKGGATDAAGETFSMSDTEIRDDGVIKKRVEVNKKNNPGSSGRQSRIAAIGPHKKLQPKVSKDSARSTSSQLRRQSRSSVEEVNKFINSRDKNSKRKSPIRRISGNRTRSPSPGAKKSLGTKKPPNNPGKSAGNKDSPNNPEKSSGDKNRPNNPGKQPGDKNTPNNMRKSPGNKNSPNNPGKSPSKNNPSGGPKKSDSTSKPVKVGERRTSSHDCSEQNVLLVQSVL